MDEIKILIFGNEDNSDFLITLLNRAEPLIERQKEYKYVTTLDKFRKEIECENYDLVIVEDKETDRWNGIHFSHEVAPDCPRIWISDSVDDLIESQRLRNTWHLEVPVDKMMLWIAIERLLFARS